MGRLGTTIAISLLTLVCNVTALGWWGLLTTPLLLTLPMYLIWVDSKLPFNQQWRFVNSNFYKKHIKK